MPRPFFRPLPGPTIVTAVMFAALIALGVWQIHRLHWKLDLIAVAEHNLRRPALSLDGGGTPAWEPATEYLHVALTGRFDNAKEAYVFTAGAGGDPLYHVIVPFRMRDGRVFLVDRGVVPPALRDPATRRAGQIEDELRLAGVWRTPDPPGWFTHAPDLAQRIWYARDVRSIAAADGIRLVAPVLIEADGAPVRGGWPRGGQTQVAFRNDHLQYAITWFGLAAVLAGVYLAYHAAQCRLGLR